MPARRRAPAAMVAAGILLSRVAGLLRTRALTHFLGTSPAADAFAAALRIPNILQNLFGEGVLSASFIPAYAGLLARGDREEANRLAGAIAGLLAFAISGLVLVGVAATPLLIALIAPGFEGAQRDLAITLVRILFPATGLLVISAWCLGILNSHRRFFLSYAAPVIWNAAIIAAVVMAGRSLPERVAVWAAWGAVAGSALQIMVQLPTVMALAGRIRLRLDTKPAAVRGVIRTFVPALVGRGAGQISAYADTLVATLLPTGAVSSLMYAQTIYMLPVSLFGMSISAAELPAMSGALGAEGEVAEQLRARLRRGLRQVAFLVIPSAVMFATLGQVAASGLYQGGRFGAGESRLVWAILAGSSVGLLATTMARLYTSAFYALRDTTTPLRFGLVRIGLGIVLGVPAALWLPGALGIAPLWGAAGLTAASGIAGWLEFALLRRALGRRIGPTGIAPGYVALLYGVAAVAAGAGWLALLPLGALHPVPRAALVLGTFGVTYLLITIALGVPEARAFGGRLSGRVGRGRRAT